MDLGFRVRTALLALCGAACNVEGEAGVFDLPPAGSNSPLLLGVPLTVTASKVNAPPSCPTSRRRDEGDLALQGIDLCWSDDEVVLIEEARCDEADACNFEILEGARQARLTPLRSGTLHARFRVRDEDNEEAEHVVAFDVLETFDTVLTIDSSSTNTRVLTGSALPLGISLVVEDRHPAYDQDETWSISGVGRFVEDEYGNRFLRAGEPGKATVQAAIGAAHTSLEVEFVAEADLGRFEAREDDVLLSDGARLEETHFYEVTAFTKAGDRVHLDGFEVSSEGHCDVDLRRRSFSIVPLSTGPCTVQARRGSFVQSWSVDIVYDR